MTPTVVEAARGAPTDSEPEVENVEIDAGRFVEMKEARLETGGCRVYSAT